jgi:fatty-acyl-CoA synthase
MHTNNPHRNHVPAGVTLPVAAHDGDPFRSLEAIAEASPDAVVAAGGAGGPLTCAQLLEASLMLAGYMQQRLEVRRGERVLLMLPEYPPLAIGWYAALRCDAGVIALDPGSTAGEVAGCLRESGARLAIVVADALASVSPMLEDGRLRGCIAAAPPASNWRRPSGAGRHPRLHEFGDALAAGIEAMPARGPGNTPGLPRGLRTR